MEENKPVCCVVFEKMIHSFNCVSIKNERYFMIKDITPDDIAFNKVLHCPSCGAYISGKEMSEEVLLKYGGNRLFEHL